MHFWLRLYVHTVKTCLTENKGAKLWFIIIFKKGNTNVSLNRYPFMETRTVVGYGLKNEEALTCYECKPRRIETALLRLFVLGLLTILTRLHLGIELILVSVGLYLALETVKYTYVINLVSY